MARNRKPSDAPEPRRTTPPDCFELTRTERSALRSVLAKIAAADREGTSFTLRPALLSATDRNALHRVLGKLRTPVVTSATPRVYTVRDFLASGGR